MENVLAGQWTDNNSRLLVITAGKSYSGHVRATRCGLHCYDRNPRHIHPLLLPWYIENPCEL